MVDMHLIEVLSSGCLNMNKVNKSPIVPASGGCINFDLALYGNSPRFKSRRRGAAQLSNFTACLVILRYSVWIQPACVDPASLSSFFQPSPLLPYKQKEQKTFDMAIRACICIM